MNWLRDYQQDVRRYTLLRPGESVIKSFLLEQGLWALLLYRLSAAVYRGRWPGPFKRFVLIWCVLGQKLMEIATGISLPYAAQIGPGLYIGHFGNIILHSAVVIGQNCNISQGVTIGISGRGKHRGVPVIGDRVYIATNAVVVGKIEVGDDAVIGANSLVSSSVPPKTTVLGVPAKIVGQRGSQDYLVLAPPQPELVTK